MNLFSILVGIYIGVGAAMIGEAIWRIWKDKNE